MNQEPEQINIVEEGTQIVATPASTAPKLTAEQNMIQVISELASNPDTDVDKVERLLDVQIKMMDRQAKIEYDMALKLVQSEMPRIEKNGVIKHGNKEIGKYMLYSDIDVVIRPLLKKHGFSLEFDQAERMVDGRMIFYTTLRHDGGHQETKKLLITPVKPNAGMDATKADVATHSVACRKGVCGVLNIVAVGDDENPSYHIRIDDSQAEEINNALRDSGADTVRFLEYMGVDCVENIPMKDYTKAYMALKRKISGAGA